MGRILGIDYGGKRCGVAVTDPLQISVNPLQAVTTADLFDFILAYVADEEVDMIVIGRPTHADGSPTQLVPKIETFRKKLKKSIPSIKIVFANEAYTSSDASKILAITNKKKTRKNKSKLDVLSAVLILQRYLHHI